MKYRIQLASNYQVVELEVENANVDSPEIQDAINLVNYLGATVQADNKGKKPGKKTVAPENRASDKQLRVLDAMGIDYDENITRQEAWKLIDKNKNL